MVNKKKYEKPVLNSEKMFEKNVLSCTKITSATKGDPCRASPSTS